MAEEENQNTQVNPEEQIEKGKETINRIDNKEFKIYFFTIDTEGNPSGGVANIYEHVKLLRELGYNAIILHESEEYHGVSDWLGEEYSNLPHEPIKKGEEENVNVNTEDIVVIPEMFSNVMSQLKDAPCKKVVLSQNYYYILELLPIGMKWSDYGFNDVITTSEKQSNYIKSLFPTVNTQIVPPSIPDYFKPTDKIKEPVIAIHTRDQGDTMKIIKSFYLQFPQYKWISFQDLRNVHREQFADILGNACLSVWVDNIAGFGTMPLESIECETPVIGKIPEMVPEWMEETQNEDGSIKLRENGVWTNSIINIPELIAEYMKAWLEDSVPENLVENMKDFKGNYTVDKQKEKIEEVYGNLVQGRKDEINQKIEQVRSEIAEQQGSE